MHTDPVHDLVGGFCKMVFYIIEKDFVAIAGLHEVFPGIYFVEHVISALRRRLDSSRHVRGSHCYAGSILIASDSTLP